MLVLSPDIWIYHCRFIAFARLSPDSCIYFPTHCQFTYGIAQCYMLSESLSRCRTMTSVRQCRQGRQPSLTFLLWSQQIAQQGSEGNPCETVQHHGGAPVESKYVQMKKAYWVYRECTWKSTVVYRNGLSTLQSLLYRDWFSPSIQSAFCVKQKNVRQAPSRHTFRKVRVPGATLQPEMGILLHCGGLLLNRSCSLLFLEVMSWCWCWSISTNITRCDNAKRDVSFESANSNRFKSPEYLTQQCKHVVLVVLPCCIWCFRKPALVAKKKTELDDSARLPHTRWLESPWS